MANHRAARNELSSDVEFRGRDNTIAMTKREYLENAIEVANRCKLFGENICRDWKEETPVDTPTWNGLGEMKELYYKVLTVREEAERVLQRARLSNSAVCTRRPSSLCSRQSVPERTIP